VIAADVTVARVLEDHPQLVDVLADYHPRFRRLRSPVMRRVFAPRVTVAQAARIAGVVPEALVAELRRAVGDLAPPSPREGAGDSVEGPPAEPRPAELDDLPARLVCEIDVREDIRRGDEPFARIMTAVKALEPHHVLLVRAPFEPIPLYDVLGRRGFAHWTECRESEDWAVCFYRPTGAASAATEGLPSTTSPSTVERIDVRGLEPPQPMVRILRALDRLAPGARLEVLHERRPVFLYPQLDDRGFAHATEDLAPGLVRIVIRHAAPRE
jgi:uncharacterized protein (DUF2249 family)